MREKDTGGAFLETCGALVGFGIARALSVVCSILVVASIFGLILCGLRLANVSSAGWVDGLVAAGSVVVLVCWLAIGRGSLEEKFEAAVRRWLARREDEDSPD
jgi:hypothetical protein